MIVSLTKRVKTSNGMRYCQVVTAANGRVSQDMVLINGKPERHSEGAYYIEWHVQGKRKRKSVGNNATDATAEQHKQMQLLGARAAGLTVVEKKEGRSLAQAAAVYLAEIEAHRKPRTFDVYSRAVNSFLRSCSKPTLEEIDRNDLLNFTTFLRKRTTPPPADYTIFHFFLTVMVFLKAQGIKGLVKKADWPAYELTEPETYEQEQLQKFFASCDDSERLLFQFFLYTGMRSQEVAHAKWSSVNFVQATISVKQNARYAWTTKTRKEREIPVPQSLITALKKKKVAEKVGDEDLIFPNQGGQPKCFYIQDCKIIARRAGLDCDNWWLHKFRATFATMHLWAGVDLRTVMLWMGHNSISSTMRYLKPNRSQAVRTKVENTFSLLTN